MSYDFGHMLTVGAIHFEDTAWLIYFVCKGPFCVFYKSGPLMKIKTAKVSKCVCQEIKVLCKHRQTKQTVVQDREWNQSSNNALAATTNGEKANCLNKYFSSCFNTNTTITK